METEEVLNLVGRVAAVDDDCADLGVLRAAVGELRRLKSWVEGREVALARLVAAVSSFPEKSLAEAGRTSLRHGEEVLARASTASLVPHLGVALDSGRLSGEHVDVVTRVLRQLSPVVRARLLDATPGLVSLAEQVAPDEFARAVRAEARRLEHEGDGLERLERQRRAIRFSSWVDKVTGMGRWSVTWDPATMLRLESRVDSQVEALFHDAAPEGCPTDLLEKQSFLRAHALLSLLDGKSGRPGRPEIIVVVDHTTGSPEPEVDWGLPVDLPREFFDELSARSTVHTIKVRNGVIIEAPGELDLGRMTRLANRAQRRALRGLYATCAIPGCCVRYSRTKLHHVIWWRRGGLTDLDNLLPVCEKHHQNIHKDGWLLTLTPNRQLTIKFPDGQIMTTGPPKRRAA